MKEVPDWLPSVTSPKWHRRRLTDQLGYFRVRTLANPEWNRDPERVLHQLTGARDETTQGQIYLSQVRDETEYGPQLRQHLDAAIRATRNYRGLKRHGSETTAAFPTRCDSDWDTILEEIDSVLALVQSAHLRALHDDPTTES